MGASVTEMDGNIWGEPRRGRVPRWIQEDAQHPYKILAKVGPEIIRRKFSDSLTRCLYSSITDFHMILNPVKDIP